MYFRWYGPGIAGAGARGEQYISLRTFIKEDLWCSLKGYVGEDKGRK